MMGVLLIASLVGIACLATGVGLVLAYHEAAERLWRYGRHSQWHASYPWSALRRACSPRREGEAIHLGTVMREVKWFGVVGDLDTPGMMTATLTMTPDEPVTSLDTLGNQTAN